MRAHLVLAIAAAALTALSGCSSTAGPSTSASAGTTTTSATAQAPRAEDAPAAVDPLARIEGSTRMQVGAAAIDLPPGWTTDRPGDAPADALRMFAEGATAPSVVLTVGAIEGANEVAVDGILDGFLRSWEGTAHDASRVPANWPGMPDAEAVAFTYDDLTGGPGEWEMLAFGLHDEAETSSALVIVTALVGDLEGSLALDVVRTLRFDG
jgi:hypothetical protein